MIYNPQTSKHPRKIKQNIHNLHIDSQNKEKPIYFYSPKRKYGYLANFSRHGFNIEGKWWPSVEHYYQAQKFTQHYLKEKIRTSPSAYKAKKFAHKHKHLERDNWKLQRRKIMFTAILNKFVAHPILRQKLIETDNKQIIERAPKDLFWGAGLNNEGQNIAGKILMEVRTILKNHRESRQGKTPASL